MTQVSAKYKTVKYYADSQLKAIRQLAYVVLLMRPQFLGSLFVGSTAEERLKWDWRR